MSDANDPYAPNPAYDNWADFLQAMADEEMASWATADGSPLST